MKKSKVRESLLDTNSMGQMHAILQQRLYLLPTTRDVKKMEEKRMNPITGLIKTERENDKIISSSGPKHKIELIENKIDFIPYILLGGLAFALTQWYLLVWALILIRLSVSFLTRINSQSVRVKENKEDKIWIQTQ